MGAKRAVPGRSLPYDMLLAAYQKKNQAKQQSKSLPAGRAAGEEDELNASMVDSDEECANVMRALSSWNPQPVVAQPVFRPLGMTYQRARLHEQLMAATNGGRVNIFAVRGYGAQRLPENHPSLFDNEDPLGEPDMAMAGGSAQLSGFGIPGPAQPRLSVGGRA